MEFDLGANEFKAYDYQTGYKLLQKLYAREFTGSKTLIIVVGANGSGKSTYIANLTAKNMVNVRYINADIIAKDKFKMVNDEYEKNRKSMLCAMELVDFAIKSGFSFIYETVFSHISKLELVYKAKELGYKIIAIYLKTNSYDINIKRVALRVGQGGHNVPTDKIISRYARMLENVEKLKTIADVFITFDNSCEREIVSE